MASDEVLYLPLLRGEVVCPGCNLVYHAVANSSCTNCYSEE